jgi:hypothetical protein
LAAPTQNPDDSPTNNAGVIFTTDGDEGARDTVELPFPAGPACSADQIVGVDTGGSDAAVVGDADVVTPQNLVIAVGDVVSDVDVVTPHKLVIAVGDVVGDTGIVTPHNLVIVVGDIDVTPTISCDEVVNEDDDKDDDDDLQSGDVLATPQKGLLDDFEPASPPAQRIKTPTELNYDDTDADCAFLLAAEAAELNCQAQTSIRFLRDSALIAVRKTQEQQSHQLLSTVSQLNSSLEQLLLMMHKT